MRAAPGIAPWRRAGAGPPRPRVGGPGFAAAASAAALSTPRGGFPGTQFRGQTIFIMGQLASRAAPSVRAR
eukprot:3491597-Pyramimonas_sp.AAC.1